MRTELTAIKMILAGCAIIGTTTGVLMAGDKQWNQSAEMITSHAIINADIDEKFTLASNDIKRVENSVNAQAIYIYEEIADAIRDKIITLEAKGPLTVSQRKEAARLKAKLKKIETKQEGLLK